MISVIMTTYNNKPYIKHALESLLQQTYKDIEIIIVDDGSTDNTREILELYEEHIRYFYKENGGEASARNAGLSLAKGEYIAFLDADDLYKPNKLEEQLKILQANPDIDVVYNDIEVIDQNLGYITTLKSEGVFTNQEDFLCMLLVRQIIPATASMMFRRKCVEKGIRYPEQYRNAVDYEFVIKLAQVYQFYYLDQSLYIYRRHSGNLTNSHLLQLETEKVIIKNMGIPYITEIVEDSHFTSNMKKLILSKILMKIDEWGLARQYLQELSQVCSDPYIWFYLGNCNYVEESWVQAAAAYEKSIECIDDAAEFLNNSGCAVAMLGNTVQAKTLFQRALTLRPEYMDAQFNLRQVQTKKWDYKITMRELRKVLTTY